MKEVKREFLDKRGTLILWDKINEYFSQIGHRHEIDDIIGLNDELKTIDEQLSGVANEFVAVGERIDGVDERVDELEAQISGISYDIDGKQDKLIAGSSITIDEENVIESNTNSTTVSDIIVSNGAPIDATGLWENDTIPMGTPVQIILEKLLNRELFPSAAITPYFTVSGKNIGVKEFKTTVTFQTPSTTTNDGAFQASFDKPSQPRVEGVVWSNETVSSATTGFTPSENKFVVELGSNIAKYTFSKDYTAPSNMPITNLRHETKSTNSINTGDTGDMSAIWQDDTYTKTVNITATGVYPCFTNISGSVLVENLKASTCALSDSNTITISNIPSEITSGNIHFSFAFPSGRSVEFKVWDGLTQSYVPFDGLFEVVSKTEFYKGVDYKVLRTVGKIYQGSCTYRFVLSKKLSE